MFSDFKFAMYPPSMLAAASVSAAAVGLLGQHWCQQVQLVDRLQNITAIDAVSGLNTILTPSKHNICITFIQCWTNVEDAGPTL